MKDTVSKQCKHYKVDWGPHARLHSSLRANTVVHYLVPVLSSEDLVKQSHNNKHTSSQNNPEHFLYVIIRCDKRVK